MRIAAGGHAGAKKQKQQCAARKHKKQEAPLRDKTKQPHCPLASRWPRTFLFHKKNTVYR
jgi:hypothetical protein